MGNALLFTGLLLGAAVLGGFVGSCCAKGRRTGDYEARVADLEERLDALATHCMEEDKRLKTDISDVDIRADELHDHVTDLRRILNEKTSDLYDRVSVVADDCDKGESALDLVRSMDDRLRECELLIGETPTGGLLGRVGALEEVARKEAKGEPR